MLKCGRRFEFVGVGLDIEFELVRLNGYIAEHNLFDLLGSILVWHNHFYKFITYNVIVKICCLRFLFLIALHEDSTSFVLVL